MGICLGNKQGNFQVHTFTGRENITQSFTGGGLPFFDSHCTSLLIPFSSFVAVLQYIAISETLGKSSTCYLVECLTCCVN